MNQFIDRPFVSIGRKPVNEVSFKFRLYYDKSEKIRVYFYNNEFFCYFFQYDKEQKQGYNYSCVGTSVEMAKLILELTKNDEYLDLAFVHPINFKKKDRLNELQKKEQDMPLKRAILSYLLLLT